MYVPWIQGSQLAIEDTVKAQPLSHGACSRRDMRVRSQMCHRLMWSPVQVAGSHPPPSERETDLTSL